MLTDLVLIIQWLLDIYGYVLLARVLMSWFPDLSDMAIGRLLVRLTEPYMAPFRRMIPPVSLGRAYVDLSALVALIAYIFVRAAIMWLIQMLLQALGLW